MQDADHFRPVGKAGLRCYWKIPENANQNVVPEKAKSVVEELYAMKLNEAAKKIEDSIEETLALRRSGEMRTLSHKRIIRRSGRLVCRC